MYDNESFRPPEIKISVTFKGEDARLIQEYLEVHQRKKGSLVRAAVLGFVKRELKKARWEAIPSEHRAKFYTEYRDVLQWEGNAWYTDITK